MQTNKQSFLKYENEWMTVRVGYLREITTECKNEIERIYKEEIDPNWLPNKWCKACYYDAIRRLIIKFGV
jgi:CRISPR/Cas system-associated exonuclease Cas4 (RecB family)